MTREQAYINDMIGDILSDRLEQSTYKQAPREQQLSYLLGITLAIIAQSCHDDTITLTRIRQQIPKENQ
jgi:hypothetical protein